MANEISVLMDQDATTRGWNPLLPELIQLKMRLAAAQDERDKMEKKLKIADQLRRVELEKRIDRKKMEKKSEVQRFAKTVINMIEEMRNLETLNQSWKQEVEANITTQLEKFSQKILQLDDLFAEQCREDLNKLKKTLKDNELHVSSLIETVKEQGEKVRKCAAQLKVKEQEIDVLKKYNMIMVKDKATYLEDQRRKDETRLKIAQQLINVKKNKEKESNQEVEKLRMKLLNTTMKYIEVHKRLSNIEEEQNKNETKLKIGKQQNLYSCDKAAKKMKLKKNNSLL